MVCDSRGLPLAFEVTGGQRHESKLFEKVMDAARPPQRKGWYRVRPRRLAGDKGYAYGRIRKWLQRRRIKAVIPRAPHQEKREVGSQPSFDRKTYRRRNIVERSIGWLKESRRVSTRFEKLAVNYRAVVNLAIIGKYLKTQLSDSA